MSEQSQFVPGQLLLKFNDSVSEDRVADLLEQHGASVIRDYSDQHLFLIALPPGTSVEQGVQLFANLAEVEFAEPNHIYRPED